MSSPDPLSPSSSRPPAKTSASEYGRRGAAERERRFYERHLTDSEREARQIREDRRRLNVATIIMTRVFGTPFRPRRRPPLPQFLALLPEAVEVMCEVLHSPDDRLRVRAAVWVLFASSSLSENPWWGSPSPRDYWVRVKKA